MPLPSKQTIAKSFKTRPFPRDPSNKNMGKSRKIAVTQAPIEAMDEEEYMRNMMIARLLQGGKYKKARNHRLKKETVEENDQLIKQFLDEHEDLPRFWQDFCLHVHENQHYIWAKFDKTGWWCQNHYSFKTSNSIPSSANLLFMYQHYYNLYYDDRNYNLFCSFPKIIDNSLV